MKCDEILELLPLYLEDMLERDEKISVESHLKTCASCKKELEFLEGIRNEMKDMPEVLPSAEFSAQLHEKLLLEKQAKKAVYSFPKSWKNYFTVAASAAVIAISVIALNSEFYKVDESILGGKANDMIENQAENLEISENSQINQKKQVKEDASAGKTADDKKAATSKTAEKTVPKAEKGTAFDAVKPTAPTEESSNGENEISPASEMMEEMAVAMPITQGTQEEAEIGDAGKDAAQETENEKTASGGGGAARSFKLAESYDKIVFKTTLASTNESIVEKLSGFSREGNEYKLPLEEFYDITSEFLAIPDNSGYYLTESLTEEYNELTEKLKNEARDDTNAIQERILEIEEICKFGYIVIE